MKITKSGILFSVACWSLLILRHGYRFGTGDQVELLPYTLFFHDSTLYPHDFFIQGLNASVPNERSVMAILLLPFVNYLEIFSFIFQFLTAVILILGLENLAKRFVTHKYVVWVAILVALIPLYDFALGNLGSYSECFQASGLSVAIVVWSINLFLDKRYLLVSCLMSVATIIHVLEGLDIMILLSGVLLIAVLKKEVPYKTFFHFILIYSLTAGVYLVLIFLQKNIQSGISNEALFKILFEFRHPHHFIFATFPKLKTTVYFLLAFGAVYFFAKRDTVIFRFTVLGLIGVVLYILAVDIFHIIFLANFQFYRVTVWIKFLGVIAFLESMNLLLPGMIQYLNNLKFETPFLIVIILFCWIGILKFNEYVPYKVPFQIFGLKQNDDMISICEKIKMLTPKESVFIQPFENTELKYYAQRSSYVEFKANVRNKAFVGEWYQRITEVFGIDTSMTGKGFALQKIADKHFYQLSPEKLSKLKAKGITHILTRKEFPSSAGSLILSNNTYAVYQL